MLACEQSKEERCWLVVCKWEHCQSERSRSRRSPSTQTRTFMCTQRRCSQFERWYSRQPRDTKRGEWRARLLPSHKSSSLAQFDFNISSIQTGPLSLSSCWPLQLVANSVQAAQSRTVIYGRQSRDKSMLYSFPVSFALLQWGAEFLHLLQKDIKILHPPYFVSPSVMKPR